MKFSYGMKAIWYKCIGNEHFFFVYGSSELERLLDRKLGFDGELGHKLLAEIITRPTLMGMPVETMERNINYS